jgi:AcrR family transcriptional regulator
VRNSDRRSTSIDRLLGATVELLQRCGYARFRPADVGARCGLSSGLVFKYFPTKLDIVSAALERALDEHLVRVGEAMDALQKEDLTRRHLFEMIWEALSHPEFRWTYELYGAAAHDPELREKIAPVLRSHGTAIDEFAAHFAIVSGVVSKEDAENAANLLIWTMQGLVLNDMARGDHNGRQRDLIDYLDRISESMYGPYTPAVNTAGPW